MTRYSQIGTQRECEHPRARHEHGSHVTYKRDCCGCPPCTTAYRRWRKQAVVLYARGQRGRVDATPSREHVAALIGSGLTVAQVQDRSGVNRSTIRTLLGVFPGRPRLEQVQQATERRLLTVPFGQVATADRGRVDPTGTARRLQALVAIGWTQKQLTQLLGRCKVEDLHEVLYAQHRVEAWTRRDVAALYDRLWDQEPPTSTIYERRMSTRARRYAIEQGWVVPLAWDDDTIDDPAAQPAHDAEPVREKGDRTAARMVHVVDVEVLADAGLTREVIAARLGVRVDTLQISLDRAARRDLWLRLCQREHPTTSPRRAAA